MCLIYKWIAFVLKMPSIYDFVPHFCPNPSCDNHEMGHGCWFKRNGFLRTKKPPHINPRYKCKTCQRQFSYNTFTLEFRKKIVGLNPEVLFCSINGMSNSSISRKLQVGEKTIRSRLAVLHRQALLFLNEKEADLIIPNAIVYDGFESFSGSQFSPCYVNTAVCKKTLYTIHSTFCPLNRKGKMTTWQKKKNAQLKEKFGSYPKGQIRKQTTYILKQLLNRSNHKSLILHTDEHPQYKYSVDIDLKEFPIQHLTTNSKQRRDPKNPLFAINHLHLNYRHFLSAQKRETIAFQKNEAALMDKIVLMRLYKNFMRPRYLKDSKKTMPTPAMDIGLETQQLDFSQVFSRRRFKGHYFLTLQEELMFHRIYPDSRQKIKSYKGV